MANADKQARLRSALWGVSLGVLTTSLIYYLGFRAVAGTKPTSMVKGFSSKTVSGVDSPAGAKPTSVESMSLPAEAKPELSPVFTQEQKSYIAQELVNRHVKASLPEVDREYDDIFSKLGVDDVVKGELKGLITEIWQLKSANLYPTSAEEGAINEQRIKSAQEAYRLKTAELLGSKADEYFAWEVATPARREAQNFQTYLAAQPSGQFTDVQLEGLANLIQSEQAYTLIAGLTVHPFEEITKPYSDTRLGMLSRNETRMATYQGWRDDLPSKALASGMDPATASEIREYYQSRADSVLPVIKLYSGGPQQRVVDEYNRQIESLSREEHPDVQKIEGLKRARDSRMRLLNQMLQENAAAGK